jgi:hypothetical protein
MFAGTTVLSLAVVAVVLGRLPATYFREESVSLMATRHPVVRRCALILKNILGLLLVALGLVLSLPGVPGQGLLTALIGLMLLDFPGKRRLERRLVSRPGLLAAINALRARFGKPALVLD